MWARKLPFFGVFFVVVLLTYTVLFIIDFIPEPISDTDEVNSDGVVAVVETNGEPFSIEAADIPAVEPLTVGTTSETETTIAVVPATGDSQPLPPAEVLPTKIIIEKLAKEVTVLNPQERDIPSLDAALLSGVVRHPDSADFSEPGNIFILGHSSYLPNVFNKNFQAFNGIQELDWGDKIQLQSAGKEYTYFVEEVYKAAAADVIVPMTPGKSRLTLATCNSFGSKDDRFIVEAKLVSERIL